MLKPNIPTVNRGNPLARGLLENLLLFELGGANVFDSTNNRQRSLVNSPSWGTDLYGRHLNLIRTSSQYINTGIVPTISATGSISVSILVNVPSSLAVAAAMVGAYTLSGNTPEFVFYISATGQLSWYISGNSSNNTSNPGVGPDVRDNKWHLFTLVRNGITAKMNLFLDGKLISSITDTTIGGLTTTGNNWFIGAENGNGSPVNPITMKIAFCALHGRALNESEVKSLSKNPFQIYSKPISLHYAVPSNIKRISGLSQLLVKKVSSVEIALTKSVAGVTN